MSRIGRKPISIPNGVSVNSTDNILKVKGPKGELSVNIPEGIETDISDDIINVNRENDEKYVKAFHGLTRSLIASSIKGVTDGFSITLEIVGTGYKAELVGKDKLKITVGYSNPIAFDLPSGVTANVEDRGTKLILEGIDKQVIGETAAKVRKLRVPDSYKGKGIRYAGESLRLKPGKAGAKA